eukprot:gene10966-474_t
MPCNIVTRQYDASAAGRCEHKVECSVSGAQGSEGGASVTCDDKDAALSHAVGTVSAGTQCLWARKDGYTCSPAVMR